MTHQSTNPTPIQEVRAGLSDLLDDLEYHRAADVQDRLDGARLAEAEARQVDATDLAMRARLVQADMLESQGDGPAAAAIAIEVNRWARDNGQTPLLARSHLILAAIFDDIGDSAACLENALLTVELSDESTPPRTRGNYLARLADAFAATGSFDSARRRYREAQAIFVEIDDVERQLNVLNSLAHSEASAGVWEEAAVASAQFKALAAASGTPLNPPFLDTLARVHIGRGDYAQAEAAVLAALEILQEDGDADAIIPPELLLTLAEVQRQQGRIAEAQDTLDRCLAIATEHALTGSEVEVLREQAELHAAAGRFDEAYQTHKLYHQRAVNLSSRQQEAAARTRQALFETTEARQEAQRYWRQARTDDLTRLPNRRFIEEELPRLVDEASLGQPLVVAIVDADHFKRVNDTFSHEVGDRVIRELARVLQSAVAERGDGGQVGGGEPLSGPETVSHSDGFVPTWTGSRLVARLGGEEFLIVLPGLEARVAVNLLESVRMEIARHGWDSLVGQLPVSVSIGATAVLPHDTQSDLLARADRCLYAAKRAGRNRVAVDFGDANASAEADLGALYSDGRSAHSRPEGL